MRKPPSAIELRFAASHGRLGAHRQQLIRDILDNCEETSFLSSREVARRYDVNAATVVRTVQALGYSGFAEFAEDLRKHLMGRMTPYTALKAATRNKRSIEDHVDNSLHQALQSVTLLNAEVDRSEIVEAARMISGARTILIVGADFAASLASYMSYGLASLGFNAESPVASEGNLNHRVHMLTSKDLLVAISFGAGLRVTVESVLRAKKKSVPTLGITDSDTTPIAKYCQRHLKATVVSPSFLNSYVAPMGLISAIHVACAHIDPKRSLSRLKPTDREYLSGARWFRERRQDNSYTRQSVTSGHAAPC